MIRRLPAVADQQLLIELFAGSQAGEDDLDVAVVIVADLEARQFNHVTREVHDPHGLTHVEQEDFSAHAQSAGLKDEL